MYSTAIAEWLCGPALINGVAGPSRYPRAWSFYPGCSRMQTQGKPVLHAWIRSPPLQKWLSDLLHQV